MKSGSVSTELKEQDWPTQKVAILELIDNIEGKRGQQILEQKRTLGKTEDIIAVFTKALH